MVGDGEVDENGEAVLSPAGPEEAAGSAWVQPVKRKMRMNKSIICCFISSSPRDILNKVSGFPADLIVMS